MRTTLLMLCLCVAGCGAIPFDVDEDIPPQTVQGSPLGGLLPSFLPTPFQLNIDVKSETAKRNTGPAQSATLKQLYFQATPHAMPSGNFDFVDAIHILIAAPGNSALPQKEIANLSPVAKGQTRIDLNVLPGIDLLPYVNAGAQISAQASGRQPAQTFTFDGHITVTIHI